MDPDINGFSNKEMLVMLIQKVSDLEAKIEVKNQDHEARLRALEGWHSRNIGVMGLMVFIMPVLATISWHLWG